MENKKQKTINTFQSLTGVFRLYGLHQPSPYVVHYVAVISSFKPQYHNRCLLPVKVSFIMNMMSGVIVAFALEQCSIALACLRSDCINERSVVHDLRYSSGPNKRVARVFIQKFFFSQHGVFKDHTFIDFWRKFHPTWVYLMVLLVISSEIFLLFSILIQNSFKRCRKICPHAY